MLHLASAMATQLRARWHTPPDDRGATAIEWAIFAILAITIAGLVYAAIFTAINNRLPQIT